MITAKGRISLQFLATPKFRVVFRAVLSDIVVLLAAGLVFIKHHGSVVLVNVGIVVLLSTLMARYVRERDLLGSFRVGIVVVLLLVMPEASTLHAIWPLVLPRKRIFFPVILVSLVSYCAECLPLGNLPFSAAFIVVLVCIGFGLALLPAKARSSVTIGLLITCALLTVWEVAHVKKQAIDCAPQTDSPFGYRIGATVSRVAELQDATGPKLRVHSLLKGEVPSGEAGSVVLIEHDQWQAHPKIAAEDNWHQREPWNENQLLGNQFWLAAIRQDKQLQSNLGGQAISDGRVFLVAPAQTSGDKCLAVQRGSVLYLGDSDYFCNGMAAYQPALLKEILGHPTQHRRIRALSVLLLAAGFFLEIGILRSTWSVASCLCLLACFFFTPPHVAGDVRVVGEVYDPHEQSRASGVVSALNDGEICATLGDQKASVLVVAEGKSARVEGESVVFLETSSSVKIGDKTVSADVIPLGVVSGIVDARKLVVDGSVTDEVVGTFDGIRVIGTGSPAKNVVTIWPPH